MKRFAAARVFLGALMAGAGSCSDSTGPRNVEDAGPAALVISDPVPASPAETGAALFAVPVTYVSFPPGTIPGGVSATISNASTDATRTVPLVAGGLDPIAIAAETGDTLRFVIDTGSIDLMRFSRLVPSSVALAVVRTEPPPGSRDMPLNLRVRVVFSEPVDATTVTGTNIGIVQGEISVPGALTVSADGLEASFQPAAELLPDTEYTLEVGNGVRDTDGSALQSPVEARFTTGTGSGAAVALRFDRQPVNTFAAAINPSRVRVSAVDALGNPATGFTGTVRLALGPNPGGHSLVGPTTRSGGPYVEFDSLRVVHPGTGYTLVATSEGLASATSAPFDIVTDDGLIAFTSYGEGILTAEAAGGAYRVLVPEVVPFESMMRAPAWAPDGSRLVFSRGGTLHVVNADGSGIRSLGQEGYEPDWSPDGMMIAFMSHRSGDSDIFRIRADGSELVRLTDTPQVDEYPDWSPDGTSIVFSRRQRLDADAEIVVMNPDGTGVRSLGRQGFNPTWSPDGTRIAFSGSSPTRLDIYVMNADGSGVTNLTGGHGDVVSYYPTWSPDGGRIAYSSSVNNEDVPYSIYVMNADGSGVRLLYPFSLDIEVTGFLAAGLEPSWRP